MSKRVRFGAGVHVGTVTIVAMVVVLFLGLVIRFADLRDAHVVATSPQLKGELRSAEQGQVRVTLIVVGAATLNAAGGPQENAVCSGSTLRLNNSVGVGTVLANVGGLAPQSLSLALNQSSSASMTPVPAPSWGGNQPAFTCQAGRPQSTNGSAWPQAPRARVGPTYPTTTWSLTHVLTAERRLVMAARPLTTA